MSREGFKLAVPHDESCFMAAKDDPAAFIVYDGWEGRRKNGHRGGSTWWHRFRCNDPNCRAVALVRWDRLARMVTRGVR